MTCPLHISLRFHPPTLFPPFHFPVSLHKKLFVRIVLSQQPSTSWYWPVTHQLGWGGATSESVTKNGPRTWLRLKRMRSVMRVHCTRFPGSQELLRDLGMEGREQCQSAVSPSLWTRDRDERRNPAKQACALHRCSPTSHATKLERNMRRGDPCLTSNVEVYPSAGLW